jgi:hypothetical protein
MPSRKSADSRSARFASDPVSTVQDEQTPSQENTQNDIDVVSEVIVPGEVSEPASVDSIIEPGQSLLDTNNQETTVLPSSNIIRQPWKKEGKQQKSYLGWVMSSVSNMMSFNVVLSVVAAGLAYYFFMYRKRGAPSKNVPEVEEQGERKSEGPKSVRSSLKFKSPTMILSEIRKNPSVKVAPTISKK